MQRVWKPFMGNRHPHGYCKLGDVMPASHVGDAQVRDTWGQNGPGGEVEILCVGKGEEVEVSRAGEDGVRELCIGSQEAGDVRRRSYEGYVSQE